jgi:hypothetical protein
MQAAPGADYSRSHLVLPHIGSDPNGGQLRIILVA